MGEAIGLVAVLQRDDDLVGDLAPGCGLLKKCMCPAERRRPAMGASGCGRKSVGVAAEGFLKFMSPRGLGT